MTQTVMAALRSFNSVVRWNGFIKLSRCCSQKPPKAGQLTDHRTNGFEKWLLAFYKKYPKGEVPDHVPQSVMERTRNKFRVQANVALTVVVLLVAVGFALQGRREAHAGYGLTQMNLDWHREQERKESSSRSQLRRE